MDEHGKNTVERLYLRKWHDNDKAQGKLPYEIIVITQVTTNAISEMPTHTVITDPEGIAYHNEQAELAEKGVVA